MMTSSSRVVRQGEIVLVPFPFTDQSGIKKRPALVVSSNWYNQLRNDCILAVVTSAIHDPLDRDEVLIGGAEATSSGLLQESVVRTGNMFTIEKRMVIRKLGVLSRRSLERVMERVRDIFSD